MLNRGGPKIEPWSVPYMIAYQKTIRIINICPLFFYFETKVHKREENFSCITDIWLSIKSPMSTQMKAQERSVSIAPFGTHMSTVPYSVYVYV